MVSDGIFVSTVEFLLQRVNGDPVTLLQAIAEYCYVDRIGRCQLLCSKDCLLRVAATPLSTPEVFRPLQCDKCRKLQKEQKEPCNDSGIQSGVASAEERECVGRLEEQAMLEDSTEGCSLDLGASSHKQELQIDPVPPETEFKGLASSKSREIECKTGTDSLQSETIFSTGDRNVLSTPESRTPQSEVTDAEPAPSAEGRAGSHKHHVSFVMPEDQVTASQRGQQDTTTAGASSSSPLVPRLSLKGLSSNGSMSARGGAKSPVTSPRSVQSARGVRPGGQSLDSSRELRSGTGASAPKARPQTAVEQRERVGEYAEGGAVSPQSEGSSPKKDKGVKQLMTPDEHIKAWLAEKKRKEVRRERHVRRRQLAELEFIEALRRTQARRLRHLQEQEGKQLDFAASATQVQFNKESAQARYRSLRGSN